MKEERENARDKIPPRYRQYLVDKDEPEDTIEGDGHESDITNEGFSIWLLRVIVDC